MPRRRSSPSRSGSMPVSARTSVDLPWSTCPAVATTMHVGGPVGRLATASDDAAWHERVVGSGGTHAGRAGSGRAPPGRRPRASPRRSGSAHAAGSATAQPGEAQPRRAPPPTRPVGGHDLARARRARPARRRCASHRRRSAVGVGAERDQGRRHRAAQRRLERGERQLVDPQGPGQRVAPQPLDDVGAAEDEPGLRAAEQLVAAARDDGRAGAQRGRGVGLVGQQRVRAQQAAADVGDDRRPEPGEVGDAATALVNPATREVARVHLEHAAGVGPDRVGVVARACVRLVVPTSRRRAPVEAMRSGRRKPSPISTSSPAAHDDLAPAASAVVASTRAAAPLLTTSASSAAGHGRQQGVAACPAPRRARAPVARSNSTSTCRPRRPIASTAAADSGARPRLVCSTTPVALSTGRSVVAAPRERGDARRRRRRRGELARADPLLRRGHGPLDAPLAAEPACGGLQARVGEHGVGARAPTGAGRARLVLRPSAPLVGVWRRRTGIEPA